MRTLTEAEIEAFLAKKEHWMILTTIGSDGYPHTVPMGYFTMEGDLLMGCRPHTQKVKNIERNPKVSALLESGRQGRELVGVMFVGEATVVRERTELLRIKQFLAREKGQAPPTEVKSGFCYIRIRPHRTISWDRTRPTSD